MEWTEYLVSVNEKYLGAKVYVVLLLYIQKGEQTMCKQASMTPDQSFFAVFCIEALADELNMTGDEIYIMLTEKSDILDSYIVPFYDVLHTQGKAFIVNDLKELMQNRGVV